MLHLLIFASPVYIFILLGYNHEWSINIMLFSNFPSRINYIGLLMEHVSNIRVPNGTPSPWPHALVICQLSRTVYFFSFGKVQYYCVIVFPNSNLLSNVYQVSFGFRWQPWPTLCQRVGVFMWVEGNVVSNCWLGSPVTVNTPADLTVQEGDDLIGLGYNGHCGHVQKYPKN